MVVLSNNTFKRFVVVLCFLTAACQQVEQRLANDLQHLVATVQGSATPHNVPAPLAEPMPEPVQTPQAIPLKAKYADFSVIKDCPDCPALLVLPVGQVSVGSPVQEAGRDADEGPIQSVEIPRFALGKFEVTRGQWQQFVQKTDYKTTTDCLSWVGDGYEKKPGVDWSSPGFLQNDKHPVVCVNFFDATAYTAWLSKETGHHYRLPTEAEWEYAARSGQASTPFPWNTSDSACSHANLADQSLKSTYPNWPKVDCGDSYPYTAEIGSFNPNPWGFHDMHGNVMEWTSDCWSPNLIDSKTQPKTCLKHVFKGGGWDLPLKFARTAYRGRASDLVKGTGLGFRVARDIR